jgi:hypothetical protein
LGNSKYLKEHVAKKILQKILSMKKSKHWPQKAHLWLISLSLLAHLIVIATHASIMLCSISVLLNTLIELK